MIANGALVFKDSNIVPVDNKGVDVDGALPEVAEVAALGVEGSGSAPVKRVIFLEVTSVIPAESANAISASTKCGVGGPIFASVTETAETAESLPTWLLTARGGRPMGTPVTVG